MLIIVMFNKLIGYQKQKYLKNVLFLNNNFPRVLTRFVIIYDKKYF